MCLAETNRTVTKSNFGQNVTCNSFPVNRLCSGSLWWIALQLNRSLMAPPGESLNTKPLLYTVLLAGEPRYNLINLFKWDFEELGINQKSEINFWKTSTWWCANTTKVSQLYQGACLLFLLSNKHTCTSESKTDCNRLLSRSRAECISINICIVSQNKNPHKLLSMSLLIIDRLLKFLHWYIERQICNKMIIKDPCITPKTRRFTTLWNASLQKIHFTSAALAVIKTSTQILCYNTVKGW